MASLRRTRPLIAVIVVALCAAGTAVGAVPASAVTVAPKSDTATTTATAQLQVLTIGDSIMNGFGLAAGEDWPSLLGEAEGWSVTNVACDGAGVLQVGNANECNSNFAGVISSAASLHPDIVIFEGSSNDFGLDNDALLSATMSELQTVKAQFPNAQIVGLSTLWGYTDAPAQLADINSQVQQAVEAVGGTYLDIGQPMSGHPELMQASDVHPTAEGQQVIESIIQAAVQPAAKAAVAQQQANAEKVAYLADAVRLGVVQ